MPTRAELCRWSTFRGSCGHGTRRLAIKDARGTEDVQEGGAPAPLRVVELGLGGFAGGGFRLIESLVVAEFFDRVGVGLDVVGRDFDDGALDVIEGGADRRRD